jgi:hypothetical protein
MTNMKTPYLHKKLNILLIVFFSFIFIKCGTKEDSDKPEEIEIASTNVKSVISDNLNISIFLDLSDRINIKKYPSPTMEYFQRDIGYINSIAESFEKHVKSKKVIHIDDRMQIFFDPNPLDNNINSISNSLKVNFDKKSVTKAKLDAVSNDYRTKTSQIYGLAMNDGRYIGSDIWGFFKNKVEDRCIIENKRNILIILTDGYMYYQTNKIDNSNLFNYITPQKISSLGLTKSNWKELIEKNKISILSTGKKFNNLEVLVLGLNPNTKNVYELDVLNELWSNWFIQMGIKKYKIKTADLPSDIDQIIRNFIS